MEAPKIAAEAGSKLRFADKALLESMQFKDLWITRMLGKTVLVFQDLL